MMKVKKKMKNIRAKNKMILGQRNKINIKKRGRIWSKKGDGNEPEEENEAAEGNVGKTLEDKEVSWKQNRWMLKLWWRWQRSSKCNRLR